LRSHLLPWAAILVLNAVPMSAQADTSLPKSTNQYEPTSACGATIDDNLAAAQKAFESTDAAMRSAFSCLLKATIALNTKVKTDESTPPPVAEFKAPIVDGTIHLVR